MSRMFRDVSYDILNAHKKATTRMASDEEMAKAKKAQEVARRSGSSFVADSLYDFVQSLPSVSNYRRAVLQLDSSLRGGADDIGDEDEAEKILKAADQIYKILSA